MKTHNLSDIKLDWAVAKALDYDVDTEGHWDCERDCEVTTKLHGSAIPGRNSGDTEWSPSKIAEQAYWVILVYKICTKEGHDGVWLAYTAQNYEDEPEHMTSGCSPLEAAMRCFVMMRLGTEVVIPESLN